MKRVEEGSTLRRSERESLTNGGTRQCLNRVCVLHTWMSTYMNCMQVLKCVNVCVHLHACERGESGVFECVFGMHTPLTALTLQCVCACDKSES